MNNIEIIIERISKVIKPHRIPFSDPWKVLLATVLSQRTKDEITEIVSKRLFEKYSDLESLSNADPVDLENLLKPIGFYREKAKRIKEIARLLLEKYDGKVPSERDLLIQLPGVGQKTANIVLSVCFDKKYIAVDTHVHRISNRLGWVNTKRPEDTEKELMKILDKKYWNMINYLFVEFGKKICRPVKPKCKECPVNDLCPSANL